AATGRTGRTLALAALALLEAADVLHERAAIFHDRVIARVGAGAPAGVEGTVARGPRLLVATGTLGSRPAAAGSAVFQARGQDLGGQLADLDAVELGLEAQLTEQRARQRHGQ